jgi:hypothetical protein
MVGDFLSGTFNTSLRLMWFVPCMKGNNDNDHFTSLGFQTLLVLNKLRSQRQLSDAEQLPERNEAEKEELDQDRGREKAHKANRCDFADVA